MRLQVNPVSWVTWVTWMTCPARMISLQSPPMYTVYLFVIDRSARFWNEIHGRRFRVVMYNRAEVRIVRLHKIPLFSSSSPSGKTECPGATISPSLGRAHRIGDRNSGQRREESTGREKAHVCRELMREEARKGSIASPPTCTHVIRCSSSSLLQPTHRQEQSSRRDPQLSSSLQVTRSLTPLLTALVVIDDCLPLDREAGPRNLFGQEILLHSLLND